MCTQPLDELEVTIPRCGVKHGLASDGVEIMHVGAVEICKQRGREAVRVEAVEGLGFGVFFLRCHGGSESRRVVSSRQGPAPPRGVGQGGGVKTQHPFDLRLRLFRVCGALRAAESDCLSS